MLLAPLAAVALLASSAGYVYECPSGKHYTLTGYSDDSGVRHVRLYAFPGDALRASIDGDRAIVHRTTDESLSLDLFMRRYPDPCHVLDEGVPSP
jgi:hypothetical protein